MLAVFGHGEVEKITSIKVKRDQAGTVLVILRVYRKSLYCFLFSFESSASELSLDENETIIGIMAG